MLKPQIKEVCVDEWICISYYRPKIYTDLDYCYYTDYNNKKYCVIHPWDLTKGSKIKIRIKCTKCGKIRIIPFKSIVAYKHTTCQFCTVKKIGENSNKDISNIKFGNLTALYPTEKRKVRSIIWHCKCSCGKELDVPIGSLTSGNTKSCGCLNLAVHREKMNNFHREQGHFVKIDHTKLEIYNHLKSQSLKNNNLTKFTKQYAKDKNYQCYLTGKSEWGNIEVHHLQSKNLFPDLIFTFSNLVCLRKDLHKEFHQLYGYGNNTASQFYEFLCLYSKRSS